METEKKGTEKKALQSAGKEKLDLMEKRAKFMELKTNVLKRSPSCSLIVVDNFYNNPMDTRNYILTQEFSVYGNYPGQRTQSYASEELKQTIQKYIMPFAGKIIDFPMTSDSYNGAFQYTTSRDRSWVHIDGFNNWAGVLFMTPDAPLSAGTAFYRFCDGTMGEEDQEFTKSKEETDKYSQDMTKWEMVDRIGNVFNRLILFNSKNYHMSMDYFGDNKYNGRLFQVFFFSTEI
jgi:Family of unknown function (DUF6445)